VNRENITTGSLFQNDKFTYSKHSAEMGESIQCSKIKPHSG